MRIVYARDLYRPVDFGGNRYPYEVTTRLVARGHEVLVVTGRLAGPANAQGPIIRTYRYSGQHPFLTFTTHAVNGGLAVLGASRAFDPDLIVFSSYDIAYGYNVLSRHHRVPLVFIYHSRFHSDSVTRLAKSPFPLRLAHGPIAAFVLHVQRAVLGAADQIIAVSPFSAKEIAAAVPTSVDRMAQIPTGVDTQTFSPGDRQAARLALGLGDDDLVLVSVGRLAPVKRFDRAVRTAAMLRRELPRVMLLVVGEGHERADLERLANELGARENVRFEGFRTGSELVMRLQAADFMLCTSDFENWSLALLEGLSCGVPIIGTPFGGVPQMLAAVSPVLIVDSPEPEVFVRRIIELRSNSEALTEIRAASRRYAMTFAWDHVVSKLESAFADLVVSARPTRSTSRHS